MFALGVIPARGGSKTVPRKNLAPLAGRPLLAYTCDAARASQRLSRTILSTDDPEVADVARQCGIDVPFMRPAALAEDDTPMADVLKHAVLTFEEQYGTEIGIAVLLQPTSPLRLAQHIDAAVDLLAASGADSVVTVVAVPHQFNPVSVMQADGDRLRPFLPASTYTRRQDKPVLFARNGPAVLAVRRPVLFTGDGLYAGDCRGLRMSEEDSIDIDTPWDLALAEWAMLRRRSETASHA